LKIRKRIEEVFGWWTEICTHNKNKRPKSALIGWIRAQKQDLQKICTETAQKTNILDKNRFRETTEIFVILQKRNVRLKMPSFSTDLLEPAILLGASFYFSFYMSILIFIRSRFSAEGVLQIT